MPANRTLLITGEPKPVDAPDDMRPLWVLRDILGMTGTKYGCGIAQCGACTVHLDGKGVRSCVLPIGAVGDRAITTIEAIGDTSAGAKVQKAWLELEVVQCGYCQSGQIMAANALLTKTGAPNDADIEKIEVHLIKSGEAPGGIGETGTTAGPPALRNAIFAATGIALKRLPIDREVLAGGNKV